MARDKLLKASVHAPIVRSSDGGHSWQAECPCGLRTAAYTRQEYADQAATAHVKTVEAN